MKKERPILFSTPMVQSTDSGQKTQTRRTRGLEFINEQPDIWILDNNFESIDYHQLYNYIHGGRVSQLCKCPYGKIGDILWVRESFFVHPFNTEVLYKADYTNPERFKSTSWKLKPSIHMPKAVARIWLEITDVRLERLLNIDTNSAIAEGIEAQLRITDKTRVVYRNYCAPAKDFGVVPQCDLLPIGSFSTLWEFINGAGSWDANPWVWVIEFKRIERP